MNDLWLIWSNEHKLWWRSNCNGYTDDPGLAGRYTYAKACQICRDSNLHRAFGKGRNEPWETMVREADSIPMVDVSAQKVSG